MKFAFVTGSSLRFRCTVVPLLAAMACNAQTETNIGLRLTEAGVRSHRATGHARTRAISRTGPRSRACWDSYTSMAIGSAAITV
jgi:hypothetical protein